MRVARRIKRELGMRPVIKAGYSRKLASIWYRKCRSDLKKYNGVYSKDFIEKVHGQGFLCSTLETYGLDLDTMKEYIGDFRYLYLDPYNNSFSKWFQDIITTNRVLKNHQDCLRKVYFSIIQRNGKKLILKVDDENRKYTIDDVVDVLKEEGVLQLRPSFWLSKRARYKLEYKDGAIYIEDRKVSYSKLEEIINGLQDTNYIVSEYVGIAFDLGEEMDECDHYLKVWMANDAGEEPTILCGVMNVLTSSYGEDGEKVRVNCASITDLETGTYEMNGESKVLPSWDKVKTKLAAISKDLSKLTYYTLSLALEEDGSFKLLSASANPILPRLPYNKELNEYLINKFNRKVANRNYTSADRWADFKKARFAKYVYNHCRPGVRPYMQALWYRSVWDDLWNTKNNSLSKKIWCWKRGFLSFRIQQYGLTEQNYKTFLSDYDYHWLNRINNAYQIWVNDKTTFRYILDPFMDVIPKYYYSIIKRNGVVELEAMQDVPADLPEGYAGLFEMLRREKKLALKPSAGTHGDGFYCLSCEEDGQFTVNGDVMTEQEIIDLMATFKSFYLVTEYINMHSELKAIYPKSVNSIRVMVINEEGYNPKIMQSYMRIGSSRTGFTDNVGYGGICVMVDPETGEMYNPETITDHKFNPCPNHPDTGTAISGKIPHWDLVRQRVLDICRYMCELEYLGFDIAITEDGFQVIEINIHQDLHKVATHSDEIRAFFRRKIANKMSLHEGGK